MNTKVTVTINTEIWERFLENGQGGGQSKKSQLFMENVINALKESLQQAEGELSIITNKSRDTATVNLTISTTFA